MRTNYTIQSYLDARLVADLLLIFKQQANISQPRTSSELVREVLTAFRDHMLPESRRFQGTEEALEFIALQGLSTKQAGRRHRGLLRRIAMENEEQERRFEEDKSLYNSILKGLEGGEKESEI